MKHRNAYTLTGGQNMPRRDVGKLMRCLMAVVVLVSSLAMFACGDDDDDDGVTRNINTTVPVSSSTVAAVQGQAISIPNGAVFNVPPSTTIPATPVTLTFNSPTTFSVARTGTTTSSGTVAFGSCIFTVLAPAAGGALPVSPPSITFPTCNFIIQATGVEVGGGQVQGTLTLVLINAAGTRTDSSIIVQVFINDAGQLFVVNPVNGVVVDTGVDTDVTGTTGSGGTP
jgi:hypothetical protein